VVFDQVDEAVEGLGGGDVILHAFLADVEGDFAGCAADVAEVGVGHLAGAVHDATHDGDGHALEVVGAGADFLRDGLEVEEGAAAARTGDELGLGNTCAGALQDVVGEGGRLFEERFRFDADDIADAVAE